MNHLTVRATAILSFLIILMMGAVVSNQANPPIILGGPYSPGMVVVGTDLTLSISLSGDRPMSFEWQFNGVAIPGQFNETLYFRNVTYTNAGSYRVIVRNAAGSATSEAVEVTVAPFGLYISTREVFLS